MTNDNTLIIHADGGARGNPGPAAIGFVIRDKKGTVLAREGRTIGKASNNVAEYSAVIEALRRVSELQSVRATEQCYRDGGLRSSSQCLVTSVNFYLDSELVVRQLTGVYKIKNHKLRQLAVQAKQLEKEIGSPVSYHHIPREQNKEADALLNQALSKSLNSHC